MSLPQIRPLIYIITSGEIDNENFKQRSASTIQLIEAAVDAGIHMIQLREKELPTRLLFELASRASQITKRTKTKLLINDRADVAMAAGADGVHLTSTSISADVIRRSFPSGFTIGVSTHTFDEAEAAANSGADFVVFGPVFESPGKGEPKGLDTLRAVCERLEPFPVLALGGVDGSNYGSVLESGAAGFAAIRFLNKPENLREFIH